MTAEQWISVEEQIPEIGTECLVWSKQSWEKEPSAKIDRWDEQREAPVSWSSETIPIGPGWDEHDFESVSHWMLLPPPPGTEAQPAVAARVVRGEIPGHGWPDWPEELKTYAERIAYQRGIADARAIAAAAPAAPQPAEPFAPQILAVSKDGTRSVQCKTHGIEPQELEPLADLIPDWLDPEPQPAEQARQPLSDDERRELLDWASACRSAYHIESTPGHWSNE